MKLLDSKWSWIEPLDIDVLNGNPPPHMKGAAVVSFWNDKKWKEEMAQAGANQSYIIDPRPLAGDSFLMQACRKLGWELPANYMTDPILGDHWNGQDRTYWIHPGSGGLNKNFPIVDFLARAQDWLESRPDREVIFSFGVSVKTKNSFAPNFSLISFKYLRSGSPSINKVSEEASNLKSLD